MIPITWMFSWFHWMAQ